MTLTADYIDRTYLHPESVAPGFSASAWLLGLPSLTAPPGRAAGGPVAAGSSYMVGEDGPELFVPTAAGTILPSAGGVESGDAAWVATHVDAMDTAESATADAYDGMQSDVDRTIDAIVRKTGEQERYTSAMYDQLTDDSAAATSAALDDVNRATAGAVMAFATWQDVATGALATVAGEANVTADAISYVMGMSAANQQPGVGPFDPATALAQLGTSDLDELASIAGYKTNAGGQYIGGVGADLADQALARQLLAYFLGGGVVPGMPTDMGGSTLFPHYGFMAAGGPVSAGQPYVVGEDGPELFVPGANGSIVPNGAGGATVNIAPGAFVLNYPIVNNPAALDQLARTVGDAILTKLTRAGARL
jgi:hypothetical protein